MARPSPTTPFQEDLYASLGPLADQDANLDYPLLEFCGALAAMFDEIETFARDDQSDPDRPRPGWAIILDPDKIPDALLEDVLPWLAQFVGVDVDTKLSFADRRTQVKARDGMRRGTRASIISAVQSQLTGNKTVFIKERDSSVSSVAGGAYGLTILTWTAETPSPSNVTAALAKQKPAGIILNYATITGQTWQLVNTSYATWTAVKAAYLTWNGVRNNAPGT
jgi:hypothetical protein